MASKIQANEVRWVKYLNDKNEVQYIITSKLSREVYYLYKVSDGNYEKLGKASSPRDLEEKYDVNNVIRGNGNA